MKYYCIGIKGAGMATLACLLSDLGYKVSGYDDIKDFKFTEKGLKERNIRTKKEFFSFQSRNSVYISTADVTEND